ncbi:MAG: ArgR family transcriptional regulator [Acidobacteriota bacterium]|nr:ArgR family transcriptional regulator [Acidobacteriota bacterium]
MAKVARQNLILELIREGDIGSQEELRRRLSRRGVRVNQATLSRDIHDLGLLKTPQGYTLSSSEQLGEPHLPSLTRLLREFLREVRQAQNLLVLKTVVGSAQPVAAALDSEGWPEILGTIAGDDNLLIICSDKRMAHRLALRIQELLA